MSHIDRMIIERDELFGKLSKLQEFIESDKDRGLSLKARRLLWDQEAVMTTYYNILCDRINLAETEQQ